MGQALWEHLEPQYFESSIHYRLSEGGLKDCKQAPNFGDGFGLQGSLGLELAIEVSGCRSFDFGVEAWFVVGV